MILRRRRTVKKYYPWPKPHKGARPVPKTEKNSRKVILCFKIFQYTSIIPFEKYQLLFKNFFVRKAEYFCTRTRSGSQRASISLSGLHFISIEIIIILLIDDVERRNRPMVWKKSSSFPYNFIYSFIYYNYTFMCDSRSSFHNSFETK